ncbi:MAG: hypothetical protein Q9168_000621 [Polycauliona sp. 1 TL-2023]
MMNPRAYSLSSTPYQQPQRKTRNETSNAAEPLRTRHAEAKPSPKRKTAPRPPPTMISISPAAPSKPVVIPTRTKTDRRHSTMGNRGGNSAEHRGIHHDSQALSPSVAAFFAIKSLRDSKGETQAGGYRAGRLDRIDDGQVLDTNKAATSSSSPRSWKLLLSTPEEETEDEESNPDSENTADGPLISFRSLSSESMPSLATDTESTYASSSPSTPGFSRRGSALRETKSRSISSSVPEACHSDHPLLVEQSEHDAESGMSAEGFETDEMQFHRPSRSSLRSNLTASLRRIKHAARNMASLGATSRDDVQPPATLSGTSRFADERRPLPWAEPPDPALRRYLNPITISPAELYSHRDHEDGRSSPRACTASIQMQTYQPGARKSECATAPPVFVVAPPQHGTAVDEPVVSSTERHREPRENSDFLRVIVLEMNMRKVGKLSDVAPGRAKLWLPARRSPTLGGDAGSEIPRRWISLSA